MNAMSIAMTSSRAARCSAAHQSNHCGRPQVSGPGSGTEPEGSYQSAPSQPDTSRKYAPRATSRSCSGDTLAPRAVCIDRFG